MVPSLSGRQVVKVFQNVRRFRQDGVSIDQDGDPGSKSGAGSILTRDLKHLFAERADCRNNNTFIRDLQLIQPAAHQGALRTPLSMIQRNRGHGLLFFCLSSPTLVPDVCNRGSRQSMGTQGLFCICTRAIPGQCPRHASWRHFPAPSGVAAPQSRNLYFRGEDCLSEASSAAQANGTGAKAPP